MILLVTICSLLIFVIAVAACVNHQPKTMFTIMGYWFISWIGQTFSLYLIIISCAFAMLAISLIDVPWLALLNFASCALFFYSYRKGFGNAAYIDRSLHFAMLKFLPIAATSAGDVNDASSLATLDSAEAIAASRSWTALSGLYPFSYPKHKVIRYNDIAYSEQSTRHKLDVYLPKAPSDRPLPILIQVPGGAWISGSKNEQGLPLLYRMASEGWACFSINYRLGPAARFPAMLEDLLLAIAWVKQHAARYGTDANHLVLTGGSAGGHLVSIAGLLEQRAQFQSGFEDVDTRPTLVMPIYGRYDFLNRHGILPGRGMEPFLCSKVMPGSPEQLPELWDVASPVGLVHEAAPPFLIVHGSADCLIPVAEARVFYDALSAVSRQAVDFLEIEGAQHAFDICSSSWSLPVVDGLARYLNAHYRVISAVTE